MNSYDALLAYSLAMVCVGYGIRVAVEKFKAAKREEIMRRSMLFPSLYDRPPKRRFF